MVELDPQLVGKVSLHACNRDREAENVDEGGDALPWSKVAFPRKGDKNPVGERDAWAAVAHMPVASA